MSVRVAAAQFGVFMPSGWADYEARLDSFVADAAGAGAQLLILPEYASLVLSALGPAPYRDPRDEVLFLQSHREAYLSLHTRLARRHGVHLLAGSFPWEVQPGRFHNRAWLCTPDGQADYQDKLVMTRFEREEWTISAGNELRVFETALGRIGVNICYDVEFPLLARAQVEAGAQLLLVPSCTDTPAGYHRVRIGAQARALENQCIVVQAPIVGEAPWSAAIDVNVGAAGIYAPPDHGFPADGILALGTMNAAGWVCADAEPSAIDAVRRTGQVLNHRHWPEQLTPPLQNARVVRL